MTTQTVLQRTLSAFLFSFSIAAASTLTTDSSCALATIGNQTASTLYDSPQYTPTNETGAAPPSSCSLTGSGLAAATGSGQFSVTGNTVTIALSGSVSVNPDQPALAAVATSTINFDTSVYIPVAAQPLVLMYSEDIGTEHPVGVVGYADPFLNLAGLLSAPESCSSTAPITIGTVTTLCDQVAPASIVQIDSELYFWTEANEQFGPSSLDGTLGITISLLSRDDDGNLVPVNFADAPEPPSLFLVLLAVGLLFLAEISSRMIRS